MYFRCILLLDDFRIVSLSELECFASLSPS